MRRILSPFGVATLALACALVGSSASADLPLVEILAPSGTVVSGFATLNDQGTVIFKTNPGGVTWFRNPDGTYTPAGVPAGRRARRDWSASTTAR